jgi:protein-arginine kinase activator protein McsA
MGRNNLQDLEQEPSGICKNCLVAQAEVVNYGDHYCRDCERKISQQLDAIRDIQRNNMRNHGNILGQQDNLKWPYGEEYKSEGDK